MVRWNTMHKTPPLTEKWRSAPKGVGNSVTSRYVSLPAHTCRLAFFSWAGRPLTLPTAAGGLTRERRAAVPQATGRDAVSPPTADEPGGGETRERQRRRSVAPDNGSARGREGGAGAGSH